MEQTDALINAELATRLAPPLLLMLSLILVPILLFGLLRSKAGTDTALNVNNPLELGMPLRFAVLGILVAMLTNSLFKASFATTAGGFGLGLRVGLPLVGAALTGLALTWFWDETLPSPVGEWLEEAIGGEDDGNDHDEDSMRRIVRSDERGIDLPIMGQGEPSQSMKCRLAPDPSLTPSLSQRARERTRFANFIVSIEGGTR